MNLVDNTNEKVSEDMSPSIKATTEREREAKPVVQTALSLLMKHMEMLDKIAEENMEKPELQVYISSAMTGLAESVANIIKAY